MIYHIFAVLWKQLKDTLKNKAILIQFVMFPGLTIVMEKAVEIPGMQEHFFANLFAVMYVGMAPLTAMSTIIAEEKEKNTLRVLQMCNVNAFEYLVGNAIYILAICMLGSSVIGLAGGYRGKELLVFMLIMLVGHIISTLAGGAIGVWSSNQMTATSMTVPLMLVFSFLPMLSFFNENIAKVAKFFYSGQLYSMVNSLSAFEVRTETVLILCGNLLVIAICFALAYQKAFEKR